MTSKANNFHRRRLELGFKQAVQYVTPEQMKHVRVYAAENDLMISDVLGHLIAAFRNSTK